MSVDVTDAVRRLLAEDVCTLKQARNDLETIIGKRLDKTTLYRWYSKGVGGTKLECVRVGNQILTSKQALTRFIEARSA